jgi:hypothetical protein
MRFSSYAAVLLLTASIPAFATVFATVHGVVHDPQHRPIAGAAVTLQAAGSDFILSATTNYEGDFELPQTPLGVYRLTIAAPGFATISQPVTVASGTNPILHVALPVASAIHTVVVQGLGASLSASDSVTPTTLITRADIDQTPGASRTIGMEMITDYVPGAYMTHDMLHMRGGHQTSWLIDGVAIPNTKIASNVGPQIDPKDIDSLETQRGSYASEVGDRTYGVFNVLPRNGFERNRDGELLVSAGNLYTGETQLSLGDHSAATAWYMPAWQAPAPITASPPPSPKSCTMQQTPRAALSPSSATRRPKISSASTRSIVKTTFRFPTIPTQMTGSRKPHPAAIRTMSPTACATAKASATLLSLPTGFTPSRPRRSSR